MNLRETSDTSIAISLCRYFCRWHRGLEQRRSYIYHNSQTHSLIGGFWQKIKICFKYSLLGRVTETEQASPVVLDDSSVVQYLINFYKRYKDKITYYLRGSLTIGLAKDAKEQLNSSPAKIISTILITAIFVNAALLVLLQKPIDLWGFLIRLLFLLIATVGISCELDWSRIKASSLFLKKAKIK